MCVCSFDDNDENDDVTERDRFALVHAVWLRRSSFGTVDSVGPTAEMPTLP